MKSFFRASCLAMAIAASSPSMAAPQITVPDAGQVTYMVTGGRVYFRNLNTFDSAWFGCCYNYYLDLATDEGRAAFSVFLSYRIARLPLDIYKINPAVAGQIDIIGSF